VWISHCNRCPWEHIDLQPLESLRPRCDRLPWHRCVTPDADTLREIYMRHVRKFPSPRSEALSVAKWRLCMGFAEAAAMAYLRDALLPADQQRMEHRDWPLQLTANEGRWRDGVIVVC
jgi:hypothetical protein